MTRQYPAGTKVADEEMAQIRLQRESFHGDWNYEILPTMEMLFLNGAFAQQGLVFTGSSI